MVDFNDGTSFISALRVIDTTCGVSFIPDDAATVRPTLRRQFTVLDSGTCKMKPH